MTYRRGNLRGNLYTSDTNIFVHAKRDGAVQHVRIQAVCLLNHRSEAIILDSLFTHGRGIVNR